MWFLFGIIFLFAALMTALLLPRIISISAAKKLLDLPDERKLHQSPVSRLGGLCFLPIFMMSIFLFNLLLHFFPELHESNDPTTMVQFQAFGLGAFLLYLLGIADDLVGVGYRYKFLAQVIAASLFPLSGLYFHSALGIFGFHALPEWLGVLITIFAVVYITNAINLIDGVDGLAAGICVMAFALYTVMLSYLQHPLMVCGCVAILGILTIFWVFNVFGVSGRPIGKLFMGDTGSLTLGYMISFMVLTFSRYAQQRAFIVAGSMSGALAPLVIPLLDILRVVFSRYRAGAPLFLPDKRHIHHLLMRAGLSKRLTMLVLLLMTLYFIFLNICVSKIFKSTGIIFCNLISWLAMILVIEMIVRRKERQQ